MPLNLVDRALGVPPERIALDDAMLRRLERALHRLEPDPLFRRRLRGQVVNLHVATREGLIRQPRRRRSMGKLGRAVLYASLMLAISVSAAGAAAQDSLPGDGLYGVKLRLEEIRMQIAPPSVRDDLAAMALAERVEELEALAALGAWNLVPGAAARVTDAELALLAAAGEDAPLGAEATGEAIEVLESVLVQAPEAAQAGLQRAIEVVAGDPSADAPGRSGSGNAGAPQAEHPPRPNRPAAPDRPDPAEKAGKSNPGAEKSANGS